MSVDHSFVEKVIAVFKDGVEKYKQQFIESLKNDESSVEKQIERLSSNINEKLLASLEEQSRLKEQISHMRGLLTESLNQTSSLRRANTKH